MIYKSPVSAWEQPREYDLIQKLGGTSTEAGYVANQAPGTYSGTLTLTIPSF